MDMKRGKSKEMKKAKERVGRKRKVIGELLKRKGCDANKRPSETRRSITSCHEGFLLRRSAAPKEYLRGGRYICEFLDGLVGAGDERMDRRDGRGRSDGGAREEGGRSE